MCVRDVVQSHLECLMQELLEVEELKVRPDGSIGVSTESGAYVARVLDFGEQPHIEVFSVLLTEIDNDPGLLERINEMNAGLSHCRVFWSNQRVVIAGELVGPSADVAALACLCEEVACAVDHAAPDIKAVFGGLLDPEREEAE